MAHAAERAGGGSAYGGIVVVQMRIDGSDFIGTADSAQQGDGSSAYVGTRALRVPDRSRVAVDATARKAEPANRSHIGAPMPGVVVTVSVTGGQEVTRGEVLLTLEAMKMETAVRAEFDGKVSEILAKPGMQVEAKDLLVVVEPAA